MGSAAENRLGKIHFLEETARVPLCRRDAERALWNWTLEPAAVTCPSCRELVAVAGAKQHDLPVPIP